MKSVFQFYSDPTHGWMKVSQKELQRLGFKASDFSDLSYLGRYCLYLDERHDMPKFIAAFEAKFNKKPTLNKYYDDVPSSVLKRPQNLEMYRKQYVPSIA